jgi:DNA-binding FrmR family transcriptional regulator
MNVDTLEPPDVDALVKRLRRVEGQIRGLQRSLEAGGDCAAILRQFTAATNALRSAGMMLAVTAFETCLTEGTEPDAAALRRALMSMS